MFGKIGGPAGTRMDVLKKGAPGAMPFKASVTKVGATPQRPGMGLGTAKKIAGKKKENRYMA